MTSGPASIEPVPLPGLDWTLWPDALLRGTGFPASGLSVFAAPDAARAVDDALARALDAPGEDGELADGADAVVADDPQVVAAVDAAAEAFSRAVDDIAADPRFVEAVAWQNPVFAELVTRLPGVRGENSKARRRRVERERALSRYWQRYCGKNDTIGFFGPVCWARIDATQGDTVRIEQGPAFVRDRRVEFEFWVLERFVAALTDDEVIGPCLQVGRQPHLVVDPVTGAPRGGPDGVGPDAVALFAVADGRSAAEVVAAAGADLDALRGAVDAGLVWWGAYLPYNSGAETALLGALDALPAPAAELARAKWAPLASARRRVAAAAGEPVELLAALGALDEVFTDITGAAAHHRDGQMYAGRRACFEDTTRDVEVVFGRPLLDALAGPMSILLPAARWLSVVADRHCRDAYADVFDEVRAGRDAVPLSEYWPAVQRRLGGADTPIARIAAAFSERWRELFAIDGIDATAPVTRRSADLLADVERLFPATAPAWPGARVHSPDVQICAAGPDALARGEFSLVLGEIHAMWPSLDNCLFLDRHPDPLSLRAAAERDYGPMVRPLFGTDFPGYTARIAPTLGHRDPQVAYGPAPGAAAGRVLPAGSYDVRRVDGVLCAVRAEGCPGALDSVSIDDLLIVFTAFYAANAFKLGVGGAHSPRISLDRLVVEREAWRTTAGELAWARTDARRRYVGMRQWCRQTGLPDRVFVTIGTETKPVFVDLTSPVLAGSLAAMIVKAVQTGGPEVSVTVSEMLPTPEQAWLPDRDGRLYLSELRMQALDPLAAARPGPLPPA